MSMRRVRQRNCRVNPGVVRIEIRDLAAAKTVRVESLESRALFSTGTGLAAAYFSRTNHTLDKFARTDSVIDFEWAGNTPAKSLGTDGFSVRWVGKVMPKYTEPYTFILTTSGGARLW